MSLTDTISTSSAFADRTGQEVDANQEMIGIGTANLAAGLFQGFPVSTSGSRTAVAERAGAKSQLTGVTGALMIAAMLLFVPGLFRNLPQPVLASVVIAASLSLADIPGTVRLWKQRRMEFVVSMVAFAGVALLGVLPGIAVAVAHLDPERVPKMWMPYRVELGRVDGLPGFHDRESIPRARPSTASSSSGSTRRCSSPTPGRSATRSGGSRPRATAHVDRGGGRADHRHRHHRGRHARGPRPGAERRGISLVFAEMKTPVQEKVRRYELTRTIDPDHFFDTVRQAVDAFAALQRPAAGGTS